MSIFLEGSARFPFLFLSIPHCYPLPLHHEWDFFPHTLEASYNICWLSGPSEIWNESSPRDKDILTYSWIEWSFMGCSITAKGPISVSSKTSGVEGGRKVQERETYVYLWLMHADVWHKPTQYCKPIILQLKINKNFKTEKNNQHRAGHRYPHNLPAAERLNV